MVKIHPSAVVCEGAYLDENVEVGPLCYVGPNVKIGSGTRLVAQCNIDGYTTMGKNNTVYAFASLGGIPQDLSVVPGSKLYLNVGDGNTFHQSCTIHAGAMPDSSTDIGSHCLFMNSSHVGHNCVVGNHVIYATCAMTAGHVQMMDHAILSGLVAIHQFCRVGRFAIISGCSAFSKDVPPFMMAEGRNGAVKMINKVGLQRAGFSEEAMSAIKHIFRIYYHSDLIPSRALEKIKAELPQLPEVLEFIRFCEESKRGVISAKVGGHRD